MASGNRLYLKEAAPTFHAIVGPRSQRPYTICARNNGNACRTLDIHRFDVVCAGRRIAWRDLAASMIRQRGATADVSSGRLYFRLRKADLSTLNAFCDVQVRAGRANAKEASVLRSLCSNQSNVPRRDIELPSGFAPLAELGGRIVDKATATRMAGFAAIFGQRREPLGRQSAEVSDVAGVTSAEAHVLVASKTGLKPLEFGTLRSRADGRQATTGKAAMTLPGEAFKARPRVPPAPSDPPLHRDLQQEAAKVDSTPVVDTPAAATVAAVAPPQSAVPSHAALPSQVAQPSRAVQPSLAAQSNQAVQPSEVEPPIPEKRAVVARPVRVASAEKMVGTSTSSWTLISEAVNRSISGGNIASQPKMQQSIVATIIGLALITSLLSGIGWFATQQILGMRARKTDPYQIILRREVVDLAKPDAQMCGELCRTGQGLIGEIHARVDEIKGAAPLRRVLMREVRSMEQFLGTTIQSAPDDPKEWRRMRLRLQRVVTDLIRLKDITDGARRSLTSKIIADELPRDKEEAYQVLGANPEASEKILKRLVDALRATWHPDLAVGDDDRQLRDRRIKQINVAWDLISEKRAEA
ncbi:MAG: hypothetical protein ACR2PA_18725 [Hyphomicrobiaceae bacterium]